MKNLFAIKNLFKKSFLIIFFVFLLGIVIGYIFFNKPTENQQAVSPGNKYSAFISEVYDKLKENYWDNISDAQLLDLFKLSIEKNAGGSLGAKLESKDKMIKAFQDAIEDLSDEQKQQVTPKVAGAVLQTLNPSGRSGLLTTKGEEQLKNTVSNINPEKNLYEDLGLSKGASESAIRQAFQQKETELKKQDTPQAKEELKQIAYAKDVLTQDDKKQRYDASGIEPTIFSRIPNPGILYVSFRKFAPTAYDEFIKAFEDNKDNLTLNSLIIDVRGNQGGAIDATAFFMGLFLGKNQYAYDFYHRGEYEPFKTQTDKLSSITRFKQVIVLVDNATQSSAEIMAASFKKYHLGVVVGVPTKGWGTVERVFPLDHQISDLEKYSMFLVHSVTLRDDNQPIEGRGVEPDVNIKDGNWEKQLFTYFRNQNLTETIKRIINTED